MRARQLSTGIIPVQTPSTTSAEARDPLVSHPQHKQWSASSLTEISSWGFLDLPSLQGCWGCKTSRSGATRSLVAMRQPGLTWNGLPYFAALPGNAFFNGSRPVALASYLRHGNAATIPFSPFKTRLAHRLRGLGRSSMPSPPSPFSYLGGTFLRLTPKPGRQAFGCSRRGCRGKGARTGQVVAGWVPLVGAHFLAVLLSVRV